MAAVNGASSPTKVTTAEKRAVHNALERKRRDHIKDMFSQLKDSVPNLSGEKVNKASRAQILKKACDYIQLMRRKNVLSTKELEAMTQQISRTKKQIAKLESVRNTTRYVSGLTPAQLAPTGLLPDPHTHTQPSPSHSHSDHFAPLPPLTLPAMPPQAYGPPLSMEGYRMMSTRLPSLNTLQRVYVADIPMQAGRGGMPLGTMESRGESPAQSGAGM